MSRLGITRGARDGVHIGAARRLHLTVVTDNEVAVGLTGVARGTAAKDGAANAHVVLVGVDRRLGVIAFGVKVDVGVSSDGGLAELTSEGTPVATGPDRALHIDVALLEGLVVGIVGADFNGAAADVDVARAEATAIETGCIYMFFDAAAADIDDRRKRGLVAVIEAIVGEGQVLTVVGQT